MLYSKDQELKEKIIRNIKNKHEDITPETIMEAANELNVNYGFFRHDADDSVYLILNNDLIYLDKDSEIIKTKGSYTKYEDLMSGVTELENKMQNDIDTIMKGNLDIICLGSCV